MAAFRRASSICSTSTTTLKTEFTLEDRALRKALKYLLLPREWQTDARDAVVDHLKRGLPRA